MRLDRSGGQRFDRTNPAVAATRDGLDEARVLGGVVERLTQLVYGAVEPVVEVHEGVGRPQADTELVPCDQLARTLEERAQDLDWPATEPDPGRGAAARPPPGRARRRQIDNPRDSIVVGGQTRIGSATANQPPARPTGERTASETRWQVSISSMFDE